MKRGFTLLELLIAMSIFSILGLAGYQLLRTVTDTQEKIQGSTEMQTELSIALSIIQRDFNQYLSRPVRDEYGENLPPISYESDRYIVEFTRGGWNNPSGRQRSRLQRVAYSLDYETEELKRHFWQVLDRAEDSEPVTRVMLTGIKEFDVSGYMPDEADDGFGRDSNFDDTYDPDEPITMPPAVKVVISTDSFGDIERIFQLSESFEAGRDDRQLGDDDNDDSGNADEAGDVDNPVNPDGVSDER